MSEELRARLEREVARNREEAILDDRAAVAAKNADGAATFRVWADAKRQRADDIEAALSMLSFASSAAGQREGWKPDRVAIAQIIDPTAWRNIDGYYVEQVHSDEALRKADAILALTRVREVASDRFASWSASTLAAECRSQAHDQLDPEFSQLMLAVSERLLASPSAPEERRDEVEDEARTDAWNDFTSEHLEDGNDGYRPAADYRKARAIFDAAWPFGRDVAFAAARAALTPVPGER